MGGFAVQTAIKAMAKKPKSVGERTDRRLVLWVLGGMLLLIIIFCLVAPSPATNNDKPTMDNTETPGTRASYLLLAELGYNAQRWEKPVTELKTVNPATTTLLLIEPTLPLKDRDVLKREIADFLSRGGRVLATGATGASLLPGGETGDSLRSDSAPQGPGGLRPTTGAAPTTGLRQMLDFCRTQPEGTSALALAGAATIEDELRWTAEGPQFRVAQRCGPDAVVVTFRHGAGQAVWWASPLPLTNGGLAGEPEEAGKIGATTNPEQAANLRLVLASVGQPGRTVLYDEFLHSWHEGIVEDARKLPTWFIVGQLALLALLLVLSLSRRSGPVLIPITLPRTSPVEFASSMGRLYQRAGVTQVAVEAAQSRLLTFLTEHCGVAPEVLRSGPEAIAASLTERFGGDYATLEAHLRQVAEQQGAALKPKAALRLVNALEADQRELAQKMKGQAQPEVASSAA